MANFIFKGFGKVFLPCQKAPYYFIILTFSFIPRKDNDNR